VPLGPKASPASSPAGSAYAGAPSKTLTGDPSDTTRDIASRVTDIE
jgi:hypothetical protein